MNRLSLEKHNTSSLLAMHACTGVWLVGISLFRQGKPLATGYTILGTLKQTLATATKRDKDKNEREWYISKRKCNRHVRGISTTYCRDITNWRWNCTIIVG